MTKNQPINPEIEPALKPAVAEAREVIQNSDELISLMISLLIKSDIPGEAIISYLVVEFGVSAERSETLYKHVYNAGPTPINAGDD